ncbi:MAG: hypothetical protein JSS96_00955 [Bacteroidetes bacterium]|nr:hypothetical protein [Bacteroidota bacterium]
MNFTGLLFVLIGHFLSGRGTLAIFNIKLKPLITFLVSMILGVALLSLVPFIMQLFYIPITRTNVILGIAILCLLLNIPTLIRLRSGNITMPKLNFNLEFYEIPVLLVFTVVMLVSIWRCFYYPPFARDMLSGPEAIAEFTVREKTMLNSIFSLNLESTNNHLKPPYVTDLQIIYKMLVSPFGQVWLSVLAVSFLIWAYAILREKLHPFIAGIIFLFFFTMPDPFAYTYIMLFDYSNMVFFFAGFYFLVQYLEKKQYNIFLFSVLLFGIATYIRLETLVLEGLILPLLFFYFRKDKVPPVKIIIRFAIFLIVPFFFYEMWVGLFVKHYLPVHFDVSQEINKNFSNLSPFFERLGSMTKILIFGISDNPNQKDINLRLYGYFVYLFLLILIVDIIFYRKYFTLESKVALYGILVVYLGMPFLGYLIPWVDLMNTTKRGLYKMFPLMLLYMRNSGLLQMLSNNIRNWELPQIPGAKRPKTAMANTSQPKPAAQPNKKNKK